jgi:hypothetical protein
MTIWLVVTTVIAVVALGIAIGTSLGRDGDREDEYHYRAQMDEAHHQVTERLRQLEGDDDYNDPPPEGPWER